MGQFMTTQRGGGGTQAGSGGDDLPWWFKYLGRAFGILGGLAAVIFGAVNCISFSATNIVAGLWLMCAGIAALTLEAPCCFMFLDFGDKLAAWSESRKAWHKVILYVVLSIPAVCIQGVGVFVILGSAPLFLTGVAYGLVMLGKKASREEMAEKARELDRDIDGLKLVFAEKKPATSEISPANGFTGEVILETPTSVVSVDPKSPSTVESSALPPPNRGMGYSPLQNEPNTPSTAPVVMSPVDFESPGPSPAHPPASSSKDFKLAQPSSTFNFNADVEQPFANPQPQTTPYLPPPPSQQPRARGAGGTPNLINL